MTLLNIVMRCGIVDEYIQLILFSKHVSFEATKRCIIIWMLTKYDRLGKFPIVQALMHFNFNAMLSGDEVSTSLNNYLSVYILMQLSVVLQYGS